MALTSMQLNIMDKDSFLRALSSIAGEAKSRSLRWKEASEFLNRMDANDGTSLGLSAEDLALAGQLRTSLNNIVTAIDAENSVLDDIRKMLII